jgi:hypothetical protein
MVINVGASCAKLRSIALDLLAACDSAESAGEAHPRQDIDVTIYALEDGTQRDMTITFNNDDMEGRDDLDPDMVLVEKYD